jgi:hypothetical protein
MQFLDFNYKTQNPLAEEKFYVAPSSVLLIAHAHNHVRKSHSTCVTTYGKRTLLFMISVAL